MPRPTRANRDLRYRHYRANGGLLPYDVWLKHHRHERQQAAPGGWSIALLAVLMLACIGITVGALVVGALKGRL